MPLFINYKIFRDKLPIPKLGHYKEDLLFYFFYCYPGDSVQLAAATELYNRDWRYHMEEKVWISRAPGATLMDKTSSYERGTYLFFDPQKWRRVPKEFLLEYAKLEDRPPLPQTHMYPPPSIPGAGGVM
ncbi:hypothetical protein B566_EDAN016176 [Ephemera danica]|nr:hypothetical protein B566_EDAN016176 [Ephemera danica]